MRRFSRSQALMLVVYLQQAALSSTSGRHRHHRPKHGELAAGLTEPNPLPPLPRPDIPLSSSSRRCFADGNITLDGEILRQARADFATIRDCRHSRGRRCSPTPWGRDALQYVPRDCSLTPPDASTFLSFLSGRTLWLGGDSVMAQFFWTVTQCFLPAGVSQPQSLGPKHQQRQASAVRARQKKPGDDREAASLRSGDCEVYQWGDNPAARVCFFRLKTSVLDPDVWGQITSADTVLLNIGLHVQNEQDLRQEMQRFASFIATRRAAGTLPSVVWRQTTAQHFPQCAGGVYCFPKVTEPKAFPGKGRHKCRARSLKEMESANFRDRVMDAELQKMGIPNLKTWRLTAGLHDLHSGLWIKGKMQVLDCTHWCEYPGSIFEVWFELLQNVLANVDVIMATEQHS